MPQEVLNRIALSKSTAGKCSFCKHSFPYLELSKTLVQAGSNDIKIYIWQGKVYQTNKWYSKVKIAVLEIKTIQGADEKKPIFENSKN